MLSACKYIITPLFVDSFQFACKNFKDNAENAALARTMGFESNKEYNEIMFLREITHTVNMFNDMGDEVLLTDLPRPASLCCRLSLPHSAQSWKWLPPSSLRHKAAHGVPADSRILGRLLDCHCNLCFCHQLPFFQIALRNFMRTDTIPLLYSLAHNRGSGYPHLLCDIRLVQS